MRKAHVDRVLVIIVAILVGAGLLIFLSASLALLTKSTGAFESALLSQFVLGLGGGLIALFVLLRLPLGFLRKYSFYFFVAAAILTALVFVPHIGLSINGARRWLDLGFTTIQPSEFLKLAYVLYVATWFAAGRGRAADLQQGIVPFAVITGVTAVLLLLQPDTDTFLVIAASGLAIIFAAGMQWKHLLAALGVAVLLIALLVTFRPYLKDRIMTFVDPQRDPQGAGYQIKQSLIAVGSGQLVGRGYGQSIQKFDYLPEASSDSIFAVFSEEFGFIGSSLLVIGFLIFALRGMWIAARAADMFGALAALGIVVLLASESFLNMAAMLGIAPVGGLPLVFVSHGGTALMVALAMTGIVLNVSRGVKT